ncbi:MAG: hydantoinase/oxoprolinase family protein [Halofilum sp. (in: g-proteobacteria)]|nr:hydantoinase/oxoprolinase family protein [Halofilum sp. (in: g-proteobacteria)]
MRAILRNRHGRGGGGGARHAWRLFGGCAAADSRRRAPLAGVVLVALAGSAGAAGDIPQAALERRVGHAFLLATGEPVYREIHEPRVADGRLLGDRVTYRGPDGAVIARKRVDFSRRPLAPTFRARGPAQPATPRAWSTGGAGDGLALFHRKGRDAELRRAVIDAPPGLVADAGFDVLLYRRLDALAAGETLAFPFAVPSRLDTVRFRLRAIDRRTVLGAPAVVIRMEPDSALLRWLVEPIDVAYHAETGALLRYEGVSNLPRPDAEGNYRVRIDFPPDGAAPQPPAPDRSGGPANRALTTSAAVPRRVAYAPSGTSLRWHGAADTMALTLGIDTGGTYTDAVLLDGSRRVRTRAKALTTHDDLARGIGEALAAVLAGADEPVTLVSLSTTLATNAVVEGEGRRVALLLVGQGREALGRGGLGAALGRDRVIFLAGGHDGSGNELAPLDLEAARAAIADCAPEVSAFAIAAHFAVRNPAHERRLQHLVEELTGLPVSTGHQLSAALDAPRRAVTALLNARLVPLLTELIGAVRALLAHHGIGAPLMVVRGDGSLVGVEAALRAPVETILSGPAASLVGARHLAGEPDAVVVDMGGTTSDIGVLEAGEPRRHREGATVAGWRTRVDAVDVHTVGLGGDSEVRLGFDPPFVVGPRRVVPLAQLAARHPRVLDTLAAQVEESRCASTPACSCSAGACRTAARGASRTASVCSGSGSATAPSTW